ncbi:hypothetical protein Cpap_1499 [Ruminiclostridium papyrosolvens DSM 2782]|uniref:Uncharacterized protein n=1 Tax=Ruminiclostridium papyrosolvens DSM 2782 TaxID=588581 RepID=F1TEE1_9FIRM|nr:hypothetical protein [Ruminiclostridium papyrosolvens]EGD47107.1 hypothetical protein Cpap_1499 [Ruminiclostridium papyrosolvens DSM 2782]WES36050.1 hypothetical protein P0092_08830 [Ruminiclostridium papyrosolvens DSM 2782]WES36148.1 hypothetical protein P0092_09330 [Ruminiclostridium papyrosolvens DSM 2782]
MKFFDFIDFPYYALICDETEEQAIKFYEEQVCDIEEGNGPPKELTLEEAKEKFLSCCTSEADKQKVLDEFNMLISFKEPTLLLIDGCLV